MNKETKRYTLSFLRRMEHNKSGEWVRFIDSAQKIKLLNESVEINIDHIEFLEDKNDKLEKLNKKNKDSQLYTAMNLVKERQLNKKLKRTIKYQHTYLFIINVLTVAYVVTNHF